MNPSRVLIALLLLPLLLVGCGDDGGETLSYESVQIDAEGLETAYTVSLRPLSGGDCYRMTWESAEGEEAFSGYGVPCGEDLLAVGYAPATLQHYVGAYRMSDGGLAGVWTNGFESGSEMMGEAPAAPAALAWDLPTKLDFSGQNPDGSAYSGYLNVAVFGGGPERGVMMTQHTGAESYQGRALYLGDQIIVVYQLGLELTVQYYSENADGTWSGAWYADGAPGLGTESLTVAE